MGWQHAWLVGWQHVWLLHEGLARACLLACAVQLSRLTRLPACLHCASVLPNWPACLAALRCACATDQCALPPPLRPTLEVVSITGGYTEEGLKISGGITIPEGLKATVPARASAQIVCRLVGGACQAAAACMLACLHACMLACLHACMLACLHACMLACLHHPASCHIRLDHRHCTALHSSSNHFSLSLPCTLERVEISNPEPLPPPPPTHTQAKTQTTSLARSQGTWRPTSRLPPRLASLCCL